MSLPAIPACEDQRLRALHLAELLDTAPEEAFDLVVQLAARHFKAPIAAVSLIDREREWLKACVGPARQELHRDKAMCAHVVAADAILVVPDARLDPRFSDNPQVVVGGIRAYMGTPIRSSDRFSIGVLCIKCYEPRAFTEADAEFLQLLARQVEREIEQRLLVQQAQQQRSVVQGILDAAPNPMLVVRPVFDPAGGLREVECTAVNAALSEVFGARDAAVSVACATRAEWDRYLDPLLPAVARVVATGVSETTEFSTEGVDGRQTAWLAAVSRLHNDAVIEYTDISSLRRAEQELRKSEERFRAITESALDGIIMVDATGAVAYWNPAASRIFGYDISAVIGRPLRSLFGSFAGRLHREDVGTEFDNDAYASAMGEVVEAEAVARDGRRLPVELSLNPMRVDDATWAIAIIRDVSQRRTADRALAASEARFRDIAESMSDWIWETDASLVITYCSERIGDALGMLPEEVLGTSLLDLVTDSGRGGDAVGSVSDIINRREPIRNLECWTCTAEGERVCLLYNGRPITNERGEHVGYRGVATEITERKLGEEKFHVIFENSSVPLFICDDNGIMVCNRAALDALGATDCHEVLGRLPADFSPARQPDGRPSEVAYRAMARESIAAWPRRFEWVHARVDTGEPFHVEESITPIAHGGRSATIVSWYDITERKRAEAALARSHEDLERRVQERTERLERALWRLEDEVCQRAEAQRELTLSEERLRQIIDLVPHFIFAQNRLGKLILANRALANAMGVSVEELVLKSGSGGPIDRALKARWHEYARKVFSTGESCIIPDEPFTTADGRLRYLQTTFIPYLASGSHEAAVLGIAVDVTDVRRMDELQIAKEAAEAANEAKSQFLANMSHEIRTPMNGVIGMLKLLARTDLTAQQNRFVYLARNSADILLTVVNDILDSAKIEAGKLDLEVVPFDVVDMVENVAAMMRIRAVEKGLRLTLSVHPATQRSVSGDPIRLGQVVMNLLSNAVKFTEAGSIAVHVSTEALLEDSVRLRFAVTDTGIGIPTDSAQALFQPFSQVDPSPTRRFGGTGLGLSICRSLVGMMHGEIGVESEPGRGSTFWFTVQLRCQSGHSALGPGAHGDIRRFSTLVIDTDDARRQSLAEALSRCAVGHAKATCLHEGAERLRRASDSGRPFDVVILGAAGDAPEVLGALAAITGASEAVSPAVVLVGIRDEALSEEGARELGFAGLLRTPVVDHELLEVLADAYACASLTSDRAAEEIETSEHQAGGTIPDRNEIRPRQEQNATCVAALTVNDPSPSPVAAEVVRTEPGSADPDAAATATPREESCGYHVLVAEDNEVNQEFVAAVLADAGVRAMIAANGREAVEWVQRTAFDAVLMDCQMPEMDGFEATRRIRALEGQGATPSRRTPIVALTAHAMKQDLDRCLAAGMDGHLTKPVDPDQLIALLRQIVDGASSRRRGASEHLAPTVPGAVERSDAMMSPVRDGGSDDSPVGAGSVAPIPPPPPPVGGSDAGDASISLGAIHWDRYLEACLGNHAFALRLLRKFAEGAVIRAEQMADAAAARDFPALAALAHAAKGAAATVRAERLCEAARVLESLGRSATADEDHVAEAMGHYQAALTNCIRQVEAITQAQMNTRTAEDRAA